MLKKLVLSTFATGFILANPATYAAVTVEKAAELNASLTPLGGERAGNADGSIPAWDGGLTGEVSGEKVGDIPMELFPGEKPTVQITPANMAEHSALLTPGTQALLKKYPDFRVDVYPTHRTSAAPQWVYDNTFKNATDCQSILEGKSVQGCYGGIPFPIPQSGIEIIWNYLLRVEPEAQEYDFKALVTSSDGTHSLATGNEVSWTYPYYIEGGTADEWENKRGGIYLKQRFTANAPAFKVGESLVMYDSISPKKPRQTWQYLVGQRRVRRAPTVGYDTPDFVASGANYFDEVQGFFGAPDRFDWKIIGKEEMYVPYNTNKLVTSSDEDALVEKRHYLNPDQMRWELHRVWIVEATVIAGKRHAVPKRRFYFDEDTWLLTLMDGYDSEDSLWRTTQVLPFAVPKIPANVIKPVMVFNLQANTSSFVQALDNYRVTEPEEPDFYTGEAVAADSLR